MTQVNITITHGHNQLVPFDENLTVQCTDALRVKHDFELKQFNYKPRQYGKDFSKITPVPATRPLLGMKPGDFAPMSEEWQWWLLKLLSWASYDKLPMGSLEYWYLAEWGRPNKIVPPHTFGARIKYTYGSLLWVYEDIITDHRNYTDGHAPESGFCDYVTGRNLGKPPYSWKSLTMTGNYLHKVPTPWNANLVQRFQCHAVEALDLLKPPPRLSDIVQNKPWLLNWETEQDTINKVNRFPQIRIACQVHGLPITGTPAFHPSFGGVNYIRRENVEPIAFGSSYSPYYP